MAGIGKGKAVYIEIRIILRDRGDNVVTPIFLFAFKWRKNGKLYRNVYNTSPSRSQSIR